MNPTNCSNSSVTVTIAPTPIDAVDDVASVPFGPESTVPLLSNDTLSGVTATFSTVTVSLTGTTNLTGATINGNGELVVPAGTPSGTYFADYQICETANPTNCTTASATAITVTTNPIDAINDGIYSMDAGISDDYFDI